MRKVKVMIELFYYLNLLVFIGGTLFFSFYFYLFTSSRNVAYIFFSIMFFLSSCVSWILKNMLKKVKFECIVLQNLVVLLLGIFSWLLMFLGGSYAAYTISYVFYQLETNIFHNIGTFLDILVVLCLSYLFVNAYQNILKRIKK